MNASPEALRQFIHKVRARELLVIDGVKEESVASVRQLLETQGAEVVVVLGWAK